MPPEKRTKEYRCERCGKAFTSLMRLQHHWAAEHAPRTSEDVRRTSLHIRKTREVVPKIRTLPLLGSHRGLASIGSASVATEKGATP